MVEVNIETVENFLKEVPIFYLTTVSNNKPKCRPIGFHMLKDGKLYFGVGTFKDVYKQLEINPYAEICACKEENLCVTMVKLCLKKMSQ